MNKSNRKLTNEDIVKYEPMIEKYIRDSVVKNWNEASTLKVKVMYRLATLVLPLTTLDSILEQKYA
jgi:hypothetical protein